MWTLFYQAGAWWSISSARCGLGARCIFPCSSPTDMLRAAVPVTRKGSLGNKPNAHFILLALTELAPSRSRCHGFHATLTPISSGHL